MHKHTYTHIFPSSLQGRKGHAPPHPWPALTREEPQRWPQHEHYHVPYPSPGPCSPSASPTSTSWPLGSGIWQGGCWLTTSQGRNGWAGKHTHTHTQSTRAGGSRACLQLPLLPHSARPLPAHTASHPTPQHNPVCSIKAAASGRTPPRSHPISLLSPKAKIKHQSSHPPALHHPSPLRPPPLRPMSHRGHQLVLGTWDTSR